MPKLPRITAYDRMGEATVMVLASVALACSPPTHGSGSGGDGGGGQGGGGGKGGGGGSSGCTPGERVCVGAEVHECDAKGKPGPVVEGCGGATDACSFGRCTTPECASAEAKQSVIGCLFYGLDTDNTEYDDAQVFGFPVGNVGTAPVKVTVKRATGPDTWMDVVTAMVNTDEINYLRIATAPAKGDDYHIEGTGQAYKAYRIESEGPIVAYQINADDENGASGNSGSTLILPVHSLGTHHFALTPPERGIPAPPMGASFGNGPDDAFVSVVGTRPGTKVTFTSKANVAGGGGVADMAAGETRDFMLNEGEVLNLESKGVGDDFSGSEIVSDKPVAVYAGNTCGGFSATRLSAKDCDHIEEAMYPVNEWGKSFVVLDMRMPQFQPSMSVWTRIVASEDGTLLTFDAPRPLTGLPATAMLNKGEVLKVEIPVAMDAAGKNRSHYRLEASKPVAVESFMGEQEGGAVTVPVDQFLDDYLISAHPWFTGHLMITRTAGTPVTLDKMPVADSMFTPAGGGYEVSFIPLTRCDTMPKACGHRVEGSKIGVTLTANGGVCNYCYAGGAGARCVNKTAGCR